MRSRAHAWRLIVLIGIGAALKSPTDRRRALLAIASMSLTAARPAAAADGRAVFEASCAACHEGGSNVLNPSKNLRLDTLKANGYDTLPPTVELLRNGKGQMPKYQGAIPKISRLTDEELELVATYTLQKAADGW